MTNHPFPQTTDEYMTQNGWVEHDNFWSLASDEWAKTTMAKDAAEAVFQTYLQGIREALKAVRPEPVDVLVVASTNPKRVYSETPQKAYLAADLERNVERYLNQ